MTGGLATRPSTRSPQTGQAMTELLICASFILVPLFLIVPMFGKFIDMQQTAIQAARYEAWEYTVWYASDCERDLFSAFSGAQECPMGGFDDAQQPFKTREETQLESRQRFFSSQSVVAAGADGSSSLTGLGLTVADKQGWSEAAPNFAWFDHQGLRMYNAANPLGSMVSSDDTPTIPIIGDVLNILVDVIGIVFTAVGDFLSLIGSSVGFDAINTDGYATSTVTLPLDTQPVYATLGVVVGPRNRNVPASPIIFQGQAGVLTDGWSAGGREHTYNQAGGTVPTVLLKELLNLPGLNEIWAVIGVLAPELRPCNQQNYLEDPWDTYEEDNKGSLWFGHIDIDAVHRDRLGDRTGTHTCDGAGRCDFDDTYSRERECIP
jgi:hypothetical protein